MSQNKPILYEIIITYKLKNIMIFFICIAKFDQKSKLAKKVLKKIFSILWKTR